MTTSAPLSTRTRLALWLALGVVLSWSQVWAQTDGGPFARTRLIPQGPVTVGQPVRIEVTVFVPSYFTGAPRFVSIDVPDALTIFQDRGANMTERVDRTTYAGQSRSYVLYPQRPGAYEVTGISVEASYFDDDLGNSTAEIIAPSVSFEAVLPPEAEGLSYFISTTELTLAASYDPEPETLAVGGAFKRTITAEVANALAMVIPPLATDSVIGLAVYSEPAIVTDSGGERGGQVRGTRIETISVVALKPGSYTLPGVSLAWWDVTAAAMKMAEVDAVEFVVVDAPSEVAFQLEIDSTAIGPNEGESAPTFDVVRLARQVLPLGALLLLACWVGLRLWHRYGPGWMEERAIRLAEKPNSESSHFDRLRSSAKSGDAATVLNALYAWYDRMRPPGSSAAIHEWIAATGDNDLSAAFVGLMQALNESSAEHYNAAPLIQALERARSRAPGGNLGHVTLPPLNPT